MIKCLKCGCDTSPFASICPACAAGLNKPKLKHFNRLKNCAIVMAGCMTVGLIIGIFTDMKALGDVIAISCFCLELMCALPAYRLRTELGVD